ncbi:MAG TPA: UvrD-helicase domain-containing protein, partial [Solirubrobacteraceae bacterium]|nr:UvrD-helicase domain-containing protein [Solirubrobacteraceae bacterium]
PELPPARPRHDPAAVRRGLAEAGRALAGELAAARGGGARVEAALAQVEAALAQLEADPARLALAELKLHRGARALQTPAADAFEAARLRCVEEEADAAGVVADELLGDLLTRFAAAYAGRKEARGALDFDDLELAARDLLDGDAELRARWSERFELLMVDELQDTNPREMAILAALDRGNLFTVGDEFQSIYGFRHAEVGIFRDRRRALVGGGGVRALSRNFRSRPALLAAINATFAPLFGPDFVPLVAGREDAPGPEPRIELLLNDAKGWCEPTTPGAGPAWRRAEAAILARRIGELIATGGARPGEVVVLLRYATAAGIYERALADRGVPVASGPGGGFYAGQEVSDLAAYARVLANPLDDAALYAVLASPLGGVAADGLAVVGLAARALGRAPWEVLDAAQGGGPAARAGLAGL